MQTRELATIGINSVRQLEQACLGIHRLKQSISVPVRNFGTAMPGLSTGRMDPRVGSGRVGSGRVTILPDFAGSGQHLGFIPFLLIISWYESI